jgi:hypothetical protein
MPDNIIFVSRYITSDIVFHFYAALCLFGWGPPAGGGLRPLRGHPFLAHSEVPNRNCGPHSRCQIACRPFGCADLHRLGTNQSQYAGLFGAGNSLPRFLGRALAAGKSLLSAFLCRGWFVVAVTNTAVRGCYASWQPNPCNYLSLSVTSRAHQRPPRLVS